MAEKTESFFTQTNTNKYFEYLQYLSIGILGMTAIYLVYSSWDWAYTLDVSPIRYVARRILAGELPYKDVIEFNMPFTYLVHVIILLFSESDLAVRIADLIFQLIGMLGIFILLKPINIKASIAAPLLFLCFNILKGPLFMLQRDLMITCLIPYIIYPFFYIKKAKPYLFIVSAIICVCCALIKPFVIILLIALIGMVLFDKNVSVENKKKYIISSLITIFIAFITVFILLLYLGLIPYFIEIIEILKKFSNATNLDDINNAENTNKTNFILILYELLITFNNGKLLMFLSTIPIVYYLSKNKVFNKYIIITLFYTLFHFFIQKKYFPYHLSLFHSILIIIVGMVLYAHINKSISKLFVFYSLLFSIILLRNSYNIVEANKNIFKQEISSIKKMKEHHFNTIQAMDMGLIAIEIVERMNLKNKYPIYYRFLLDLDNTRLNSYKDSIMKDLSEGKIDIFMVEPQDRKLRTYLKNNYDSLFICSGINGFRPVIIYKSKKIN
jgi:hypothetical protein